jgi:AcrR family transcriptional regulator
MPRRRASDTYHHGDLRNALVREASAIIEKDGFDALSLRELARRLGVTQAAPYHHFANKEALVGAVAAQGFETLYNVQLRAAAAARPDPRAKLEAIGLAYVTFALEHGGYFHAMFRRSSGPAAIPGAAPLATWQLLRETVRACGGDDTDAVHAWSVAHGLATLWIDGPLVTNPNVPRDRDHLVRRVIRALARGIGA